MDTGGLIRPCLLIISIYVCVVSGSPLVLYSQCSHDAAGDVELVTGINSGMNVKLVPYLFPTNLEFLELFFTSGNTSAIVRTKKALDAEAEGVSASTLYYSVMCDGPIKYNNSRSLRLNDINDHAPVFSKELYTSTVSEDPASGDFGMDNSGAIILRKRLNYNAVKKYNFVVKASDSSGLNDVTNVEIDVEDFDNLNPYFSHTAYQAFIPENQAGSFPIIEPEAIKAQDGDTGINMTLIYSISSVSPDKYRTNFNIDPTSGVLSVLTAIDREEMSTSVISVNIMASQTDDSSKTANAVVSVTVEDVNDNAPEFDQRDYSVNLMENSPVDAVVFKAIVTDLDQGGFVGTLQILPESVPFSIGSDGTVKVKNSTALDRETTERITFQIQATEKNPPHAFATAQVTVTLQDENDNSPAFTSDIPYEGKVFANQTVGMLLVQVKAEDPDADRNGQISYFIEFGNKDGYFSMEENTGKIMLAKTILLVENKILEFPLYVTAKDGGSIPRSTSALVIIRAPGNSKPQFLQEVFRGTVEEEQDPGVVILRVNFYAMPDERPVTLRVDTENDKFAISPEGEFTTKVKLDYDEAPHNYSVTITISDGVNSDSAIVEVQVTDINDNGPVFASSSVTKSVPEDKEIGSNVTDVPATDKDSSFNKEIRYSLRGGEGKFAVDPVSGMVTVAGALDRETKTEYNLLVVAEDQGRPARSATATLLVQVSDVNDNIPKLSKAEYQVEVYETESVDTVLLTLSAEDPDEGANGRVTYNIFEQSPPSDPAVFKLDSSSGTLQLARTLENSEVKMYSLIVQASDGGSPSLVGNGSVVVTVKDVNNNPPEFSKENYNVAVSENLASGASILTLEVTDRDEGGFSNGFFVYTSDTFDISNKGVVSLKKDVTLDREKKDSYIFQVVAVDQVPDGLYSTAQLNITILDYNDNAPKFPAIPDPLEIPEGEYSEETPGEIVTIIPTDADLGLNGEVTLSLSSPNPLFKFNKHGMLLAVGSLDRESRDTYELIIKASDKGSPQRENITTIRVNLIDVNDNRPEFSSSSYVSSILLKDAEKGKLLLTLTATDRDEGKNALITYSFSTGSSPYLALNSETGAVNLTSDLADVTEDTTLVLTAMAKDHGTPPLNSTVRVVVNLRVSSLVESVAFRNPTYNFSLPENQPVGVTVGSVWASSGSDLYDVAYTLKTHTDLFSVSASGAIQTRTQLDKEEQEWYILDVEAVDTRDPPTSAVAIVTVQVEDVNETPQFPPETYKASVFSIAPYRTPVIQVKASDPDVGEEGQLVYSLATDSPHFNVEPSSGLVYVVSAEGVAGLATVDVKATDPRGLHATTKVEVEVTESASSDVVVMSLNQPANTVEKKVPEMEKSLGAVLGWTVNVIAVSSVYGETSESRRPRAAVKTLVSFICGEDGGEVIPAEEVQNKVKSQSADVKQALVQVFGDSLDFDIETGRPQDSASNQAVVIALGVLLAVSMVGLTATVALIIRNRNFPETLDQGQMKLEETGPDDEKKSMDRQSDDEDEKVKTDSMRIKPKFQTDNKESDSDDSPL
ncbi:Protocadherin Fat 4 FAT tumor suppressor -like protein 4 [Collichthys lucidus]|uniref:Protocadherin Fat 4 FAT tumor suppressor-like protein 4 n=1 Tax=Collichthys lucidus TaxID=240159 RepID=A0A4U5U6X7_COLLU|nr:Protocadherin Fat 4 FAT tumor suppressor -like protein 4 [Collichthys lucidus]